MTRHPLTAHKSSLRIGLAVLAGLVVLHSGAAFAASPAVPGLSASARGVVTTPAPGDGPVPRTPPAAAPAESLDIRLWETSLHSDPQVAHRGQPFELHIHLVWGSPTGDEVALPLWRPRPGYELRETGYQVRSTRDQPGGGYAMHAKLIYRLVATKEGVVPLDSLTAVLARGPARRVVALPPTAMEVLPPLTLKPHAWNLLAFLAGACALAAGLTVAGRQRRRPTERTGPGPTPDERAAARLKDLAARSPDRRALAELVTFLKSEAVRRHGGHWSGSGDEAFRAWAAACTAPEMVRDRVGALAATLEVRCYEPGEPDPASWQHWIEQTERLWRVEEALASAGRS
ncbi:MAG: hypothetical protein HZB25_01460 [Candidatus Eisenbacteria bacterium]|nr:hypothetical protein [Candidatus Eisenbacteria bacterium]